MVDDRLMHVLWYQNQVGDEKIDGQSFYVRVLDKVVSARQANDAQFEAVLSEQKQRAAISEQDIEDELARRQMHAPGDLGLPQKLKPVGTGNCLIIPLLGKWDSIRLLNTSQTPKILQDVSKSLAIPEEMELFSRSFSPFLGVPSGGIIFLESDIYYIVLAERAADIPYVLPQIKAEKRPQLNDVMPAQIPATVINFLTSGMRGSLVRVNPAPVLGRRGTWPVGKTAIVPLRPYIYRRPRLSEARGRLKLCRRRL